MRSNFRALLMTALIGATSPLLAQEDTPVQPPQAQTCNALCQLVKGIGGDRNPPGSGSAAATPSPAAAQEQAVESEPRARRRAAKARRSPDPAAVDGSTGAVREKVKDAAHPAADAATSNSVRILMGPDDMLKPTLGDLADVLQPQVKLETVRGKGAALKDLLTLPRIDMAVVTTPMLSNAGAAASKLVYVAKLFGEELHVVAGPGVTRIEDLAGKTVYLGQPGSDTELVARAVLKDRGVEVVAAPGSFADALAAVQQGKVAAAVALAPKPFAPLTDAGTTDGLHLVPVALGGLGGGYDPAALTSADYPGLVKDGERVETVAADAVLIAPWWRESSPRQQELNAATKAIFTTFPALLKDSRHPKWRETNLAAVVEGARRAKSADQWVQSEMKARRAGGRSASVTP